MHRTLAVSLTLALLAGCGEKKAEMMDPRQKPDPAPELAKLDVFLGSWTGTATIVEPSREEMMKNMPPDAPEMPTTFEGANRSEWVLGGHFLKMEGWHEEGPNDRRHYTAFWTWDEKAGKFYARFFTDTGAVGEEWMTADDDGKTFHTKFTETDTLGNKSHGSGTMTVVSDDKMTWDFTMTMPEGKMRMTGESTRQR